MKRGRCGLPEHGKHVYFLAHPSAELVELEGFFLADHMEPRGPGQATGIYCVCSNCRACLRYYY